MKKKRVVFKKEFFKEKLMEYDGIIILVAFLIYGTVFGVLDAKYGDCGLFDMCDMGLDKFIYGTIIANIIVLIVELICFIKLIKKSPKRIDVPLLSFVCIAIIIPILLYFVITSRMEGFLFFLMFGIYNIVLFIVANAFLLSANNKKTR